MQSIKKILVVVDPERSEQPALEKALHFARQGPIAIRLLSCLYYPSVVANNLLTPTQLEKTQAAILRMNRNRMEQLINSHSHENVSYESLAIWMSPIYRGILDSVEDFKPDLVVKATHPHKSMTKRLFTPTDFSLLNTSPAPVLLVKGGRWTDDTCIAAAVDPDHSLSQESGLDNNILGMGFAVSNAIGRPLHAVHCFDPSYWDILIQAIDKSGLSADVFSVDQRQNESSVLENLRYQHNMKFAQQCSEYVPKSENQHLISGEIEHVMSATLERLKVGILVLGTTYRSGLLGSTAEKLVETLDCDLLAVKPNGFSATFT